VLVTKPQTKQEIVHNTKTTFCFIQKKTHSKKNFALTNSNGKKKLSKQERVEMEWVSTLKGG
jgi:hypothetical protein